MADARSEPREVELKFAVPSAHAADVLAAIKPLAGAEPKPLTSTYFDTDKGALRRAKLALRVRRSGGCFVQTLKDSGDGGFSRGEWEAPVKRPEPDLAALKGTPAAKLVAKANLAPVYSVEYRRRTAEVVEGESRIEIAFDEGVARAGDHEAPFAELELELKDGPQWGLFALARRLGGAADLTLSFTSKADRGLLLARPPRSFAQKFAPPPLTADLDAGGAFQAVGRACLRQICANAERLRHRPSPEVIHQLRVGLRRLRSLITSFKRVVADARLAAIKAELKWLTGELDAARNLDVLLHGEYRIALVQKDDPDGLKGLGTRLRGARRMAYVRAAGAVEGERFRRLLIDLLVWIESGPWTGAEPSAAERRRPIDAFAAHELKKRRSKIVKRGKALRELTDERRHKLRIEAKKLRYAADVFAGLYGRRRRASAFIEALKAVQDALGELNDIVVGERLAHEAAVLPGRAETDSAFVAGRITGAQKARIGPLTDRAEAAIAQFAEAKPFWK
ncbi:MAG TPA: CHAD domain-containing protein [Caulobacteraceae bacterium]|jgi:inorganic triphosphatase YgiF|nr:CHAD domain-containing protein [Caulobacteraceae bacterium]